MKVIVSRNRLNRDEQVFNKNGGSGKNSVCRTCRLRGVARVGRTLKRTRSSTIPSNLSST